MQAKADLRKKMTDVRKAAQAKTGEDAADGLAAQILALFDSVPKQTPVSLYWPIGSEIDTQPLMIILCERGHVIGLPRTPVNPGPLTFHSWRPDSEMEMGAMNIPVPKGTPIVVPQILLVPLLAFDQRGFRLGYGGGYYDRTLMQARAQRRVLAIGLAYDQQEIEKVPTDANDQPLDMIITPTQVFEASKGPGR